jgi:hypothetical protein
MDDHIVVWPYSRIGAAAFTLWWCSLPLTNTWQGSADAITDSSWVVALWDSYVFNCCHFFSRGATNARFCSKLGKTPIETYEMLQTACGDEALSRSRIFDWFKRSSWWFKKRATFNLSKCKHSRKYPWNADTRSSVGSQNDGGWIKHK